MQRPERVVALRPEALERSPAHRRRRRTNLTLHFSLRLTRLAPAPARISTSEAWTLIPVLLKVMTVEANSPEGQAPGALEGRRARCKGCGERGAAPPLERSARLAAPACQTLPLE